MHSYTAYGLALQSDIPLPELIEAASHEACWTSMSAQIQTGRIDRNRPAGAGNDPGVWATPDAIFLQYEKAAAFLIRGGSQILVEPVADVDPRVIRLFLLGPVLALLLHQRGFLVLHASAIQFDGEAVAFVGDKGMGKSTMAAALHARGHALVADDIVAIDAAPPRPIAYPGFPQLKLFPESAELLDDRAADLPRVHPEFEKRARGAHDHFASGPLPLKMILELVDGERDAIEAVGPQSSFMTLVRHSYVLPLLNSTGAAQSHFRQTVSVAASVPVRRLVRRRDLANMPRVAELVEDYVAGRD